MKIQPKDINVALASDGKYDPGWYFAIIPIDKHREFSNWKKSQLLKSRATLENREAGQAFIVLEAPQPWRGRTAPPDTVFGLYQIGTSGMTALDAADPYTGGIWEIPEPHWIHQASEVAEAVQEGAVAVAQAATSGLKTAGIIIGAGLLGLLAYKLLRK